EGLPARNIKKFSSRKFRQNNFFKYYFLKRNYKFEDATPENIQIWKEKITDRCLMFYIERRRKKTKTAISQYSLETAVKKDLMEIFDRIEAHHLPYIELYDEL